MRERAPEGDEGGYLRTGKTRKEKTRQERPALFSLCFCDGIHLAGQRLSRSLVLDDETPKDPTVHQGDDLQLLIL